MNIIIAYKHFIIFNSHGKNIISWIINEQTVYPNLKSIILASSTFVW